MTIDQILIAMRQAGTNAYSWSLPRREAEVLVAEVERLRGEAAQEREAERAAVVAWLREQRAYGTDALLGAGFASVCGILADAIERGEHRREEEK